MGWLERVQTTVWARHEDVRVPRIHSKLNLRRKTHLTVLRPQVQLKKSTLVAADFQDFLTDFIWNQDVAAL